MKKFYDCDPAVQAAHALELATLRSTGRDQAGLLTLAKKILAKARPCAYQNPDEVLYEAHNHFTAGQWQADNPGADPVKAIAREPIHADTMAEAVQVLDRTRQPSTPGCADDVYQELVLLLHAVFCALHLALDIAPITVLSELSDGRVTEADILATPSPYASTGHTEWAELPPF